MMKDSLIAHGRSLSEATLNSRLPGLGPSDRDPSHTGKGTGGESIGFGQAATLSGSATAGSTPFPRWPQAALCCIHADVAYFPSPIRSARTCGFVAVDWRANPLALLDFRGFRRQPQLRRL